MANDETATLPGLTGKTALVTGASSGIGAALARELAASGARVGMLARRKTDLENIAQQARNAGHEALALVGDVTDMRSLNEACLRLQDRWGPPDFLVNAAGSGRNQVFLCDQKVEDWVASVDVNLVGAFRVCRAVVPHMIEAGRGSIVLLSSVAGRRALPANTAYCAARFGLRGFTESLAMEIGPFGVRVNALAPGLTEAPSVQEEERYGQQFMESLRKHHGPVTLTWERYLARAVASNSLRRMVTPREVSDAALFLLSSSSSGMTGHVLDIDAGVP